MILAALYYLVWFFGITAVIVLTQSYFWKPGPGRSWQNGIISLGLGAVSVGMVTVLFVLGTSYILDPEEGPSAWDTRIAAFLALVWPSVMLLGSWSYHAPLRLFYLPLIAVLILSSFAALVFCDVSSAWALFEAGKCGHANRPYDVWVFLIYVGLMFVVPGMIIGYALKFILQQRAHKSRAVS